MPRFHINLLTIGPTRRASNERRERPLTIISCLRRLPQPTPRNRARLMRRSRLPTQTSAGPMPLPCSLRWADLTTAGNGTITFSDGNHANDVVVQIVNGLPVSTYGQLVGDD